MIKNLFLLFSNDEKDIIWTTEALTAFTNLLSSYISTIIMNMNINTLLLLLLLLLGISSRDLEAFARHGKRSTIGFEDVKLLCRRNESFEKVIQEKE